MIIFQTAGGGAGGFTVGTTTIPEAYQPHATTFRSDEYIHGLNRTLQAEMRALSAYRAYAKSEPTSDHSLVMLEEHQAASRELVRLIVLNRGVPEDRSALSLGLTRTFIQICAAFPSRLLERATLSTLSSLERHLVARYQKILKDAPARDAPALEELLRQTESRIERFV